MTSRRRSGGSAPRPDSAHEIKEARAYLAGAGYQVLDGEVHHAPVERWDMSFTLKGEGEGKDRTSSGEPTSIKTRRLVTGTMRFDLPCGSTQASGAAINENGTSRIEYVATDINVTLEHRAIYSVYHNDDALGHYFVDESYSGSPSFEGPAHLIIDDKNMTYSVNVLEHSFVDLKRIEISLRGKEEDHALDSAGPDIGPHGNKDHAFIEGMLLPNSGLDLSGAIEWSHPIFNSETVPMHWTASWTIRPGEGAPTRRPMAEQAACPAAP